MKSQTLTTAPKAKVDLAASTEHVRCYLCDADDTHVNCSKRGRTIVQCNLCGLLYTNPRPKNDALFSDTYDVGEKYRVKTEKVTKPGRLLTYRRFLKELEPFRQTNRVLEIGSGFGYFLNEAKSLGWKPIGVEISPFSVDYAHRTYDAKSLLGTLEEHMETLRNGEKFDVIALWNVFEHLPDPVGQMRRFHDLLRPGGAVIIKVPDARVLTMKPTAAQRLWHQIYIHRYFPLHPHMHLVHLTPDSFAAMAKAAGFEPPVIDDYTAPRERPTRNWRQALRSRLHIALKLPCNFVAITRKPDA